jgi:hypothetical protein
VSPLLSLSALLKAGVAIPAISYRRVSSGKQLLGEGLRRQKDGTLTWIGKHPNYNIRLDDELTDAARSAWKGEHVNREDGALGKLLRMVESGELKPPLMIIVEHLDRLDRRNPWKATHQLSGMVSKGIFVATTQDDKVYSLESGVADIILSVVYMCAAHDESQNKSGRVSKTKRQHVLDAMTTKHVIHQNAPGWMVVHDAITSTNRAARKYVLIPEHCETVLRIYQMGLNHGAAYICSWLIANHVPAMGKTGKWNIRHVKRILRSRAVLGYLESRHGLMENQYPTVPGITESLWLRVQAAQKTRRDDMAGGYKLGSTNNLLAGIGRCTVCSGKMRINTRSARRYYECQRHVVLHDCANRSRYRVDRVEDAIFEHLGFLEITGKQAVAPGDLKSLAEEHAEWARREKFQEAKLQEVDGEEEYQDLRRSLAAVRLKLKDAATALSAAQQRTAALSSPVVLNQNADRAILASGLKDRLVVAYFFPDRSVQLISKGGILLVIPPDEEPALMFKRGDGQVAIVRGNRVRIVEGGLPEAMPALDAQTIGEVQARLTHT